MKILYVTNLYPPYSIGGYELICASVNRAMQERGHETRVLTSDHGVAERGTPDGESNVKRTLRIHGFFGHPWLGICKLRSLEMHNNNALREAIAEFRPDAVHVFNLGGISKSLAHTLQRANVPTVYFVSDHWIAQSLAADVWMDWWNRPSKSLSQKLIRRGLELCGARAWLDKAAPTTPARELEFRRIYFCSQFLRDQAVSRGYDVSHAAVIHNAVDTKRFTVRQDRDATCTRWLFVGRLAPEKGIRTVLRAVSRIGNSFPGTLTICGRGTPEFESELRAMVQTQKLPVTFIEATAAEMPEIYQRHDALLFPSEWEEPFALTPLEAMACGLPVIATTTGGSAELFRDGVNALTFKAGDDEDLVRQIRRLSGDSSLRTVIATNGCDEVRGGFREDAVMDRIEKYVAETVGTWPEGTSGKRIHARRQKTEALAHA
jgi:glycosyltransferase involved in cell wall biosynthesis